MDAKEIIERHLTGSFITRFSVGDTWDLNFSGCWIIAQNIFSPDEQSLNSWIYQKYKPAEEAVDQENISKAAIVTSLMRKEVLGVDLDAHCKLTIKFEGGHKLLVPTDVAEVDWQWCLNTTGADPYTEHLVACFWKGEIEIDGSLANKNKRI